jgi:exopolysaccharide biosynthesis WecB/TagA/CpsF family protein
MPHQLVDGCPTVEVGPFTVVALSRAEVVDRIVSWPRPTSAVVICHLHVGALNHRDDPGFVAAMDEADLVYADGMATVLIARFAGAGGIERAGLTDIGHDILDGLNARLGRPTRVALLGGPEGLAARAGIALRRLHGVHPVFTAHGFRPADEWAETLRLVRAADPDIVFVGLGMPAEAIWAGHHRDELPPCLVLAAGGFFGHVTGEERRAPQWAQSAGLEWMWRLAQRPRGLTERYARGMLTTAALSVEAAAHRRR